MLNTKNTLLFYLSLLLLLLGCESNFVSDGNGSNVGTGMVGCTIFNPDGKTPAIDAYVELRNKNTLADITAGGPAKKQDAVLSARTDRYGNFHFDTLPEGLFIIEGSDNKNNMVLFDSIRITKSTDTLEIKSDTLKPAGSIRGMISLPKGGNPQQVFILAFGVDRFSQVNSDGSFLFTPFAEGTYTLKIISLDTRYGTADTSGIIVVSGDTTDIGIIELPFKPLIVSGVSLTYDTLPMVATITWQATPEKITKGYNVYRKLINCSTQEFNSDNEATYHYHGCDTSIQWFGLFIDTIFYDTFFTLGKTIDSANLSLSRPTIFNPVYSYTVTMVDTNDNESEHSDRVETPFWSVFELYDTLYLNSFPSEATILGMSSNPGGYLDIISSEETSDQLNKICFYRYTTNGLLVMNKVLFDKLIPANPYTAVDTTIHLIKNPYDSDGNFYFYISDYSVFLDFNSNTSSTDSLTNSLWRINNEFNVEMLTPLPKGYMSGGLCIVNNALYFLDDSLYRFDLNTFTTTTMNWESLGHFDAVFNGFGKDDLIVKNYNSNPSIWINCTENGELLSTINLDSLIQYTDIEFNLYNAHIKDSLIMSYNGCCKIEHNGKLTTARFENIFPLCFTSDKVIYTRGGSSNELYICRIKDSYKSK